MKKLILLLAACAAFASCKKENNNGKLDPNAMVALNPAPGTRAYDSENPEHLTARQIVEQATGLMTWNRKIQPLRALARGFGPSDSRFRDYENNRLLMLGTDIIEMDGQLITSFLEGEDIYIMRVNDPFTDHETLDTIAYLPNAQLRAAEQKIKAAYASEDYTECYRLFNEAFTFYPVTGAEFKEMLEKGEN